MTTRVYLVTPALNTGARTLSVIGDTSQAVGYGIVLYDNEGTRSFTVPWRNVSLVDYQDGSP